MRRGKRILALIIAVSLVCGLTFCSPSMRIVYAEDGDESTEDESEKTYEEILQEQLDEAYAMDIESNDIKGWPDGPGTYGEAAIVMEVGTGAILYAKNIDAHYYPASITKLLTALVAFENSDMDDTVKITDDCVDFLNWDDAAIGLKAGDKLSMKDTMYAMLLASANEAAYAVGLNVARVNGHSYKWFIKKMNQKVKELGGNNSHFVNTNGLHNDKHYTCARDMALIGRALFDYPEFFKISQTLQYTIKKTKTVEEHTFQQYHHMLYQDNADYYEYCIGGKTGYTDQALSTLVTMTDNGDMQLVCVVLKTYGVHVYPDTRNLCDYAYDNFSKVSIADNLNSKNIASVLEDDEHPGYVVLPSSVEFSDLDMELVPDDETMQTSTQAIVTYSYKGNEVGSARVQLSDHYIARHEVKTEEDTTTTIDVVEQQEKEHSDNYLTQMSALLVPYITEIMASPVLKILAAAVLALMLLLIIFIRYRRYKKKKLRAKKRREQKLARQKAEQEYIRMQREREERMKQRAREVRMQQRRAGMSEEEIAEYERREAARRRNSQNNRRSR